MFLLVKVRAPLKDYFGLASISSGNTALELLASLLNGRNIPCPASNEFLDMGAGAPLKPFSSPYAPIFSR